MYLIFIMYALFGTVFTAGKISLDHAHPFFLVGIRMLIAGSILLIYAFYKNKNTLKIDRQDYFKMFLLSLFNIYITNGFEFWGMKFITTSKTSFIYSLSPFISALFSYFFLGEVLSKKKWLGLLIGIIGFFPILLNQSAGESELGSFFFLSTAELAVITATFATVIGWIVMRQLVKSYSPMVCNAYSMFFGGLMSLLHSFLAEPWQPVPIFGSLQTFTESILWMLLISNLICYNLYALLLKKYTVSLISFSGFSTPFFTALFSWIMIGETLSLNFLASAIVVLCGLYLFYQEELQKGGLEK